MKGAKWAKAHHFDTPGKLPAHAGKKGKAKRHPRGPGYGRPHP